MKKVAKRSVIIAGRKTSISLEEDFWVSAKEIAAERGITVVRLVEQIHGGQTQTNLSSAIRLFLLNYYKSLAEKAQT